MPSVTFNGLSSGLDTASLVSSLVAAERAPANILVSHQSDLTTQKSIVNSMSSALAALGTAVRGLDVASEAQPRKVTSSDSKVAVAASAGAIATAHDVHVEQLARAQIAGSKTFTSQDAGAAGAGSLTITTGSTTKQIDYTASDSLSAIAAKINGAGVAASASVLFDGTSYRLMVASTATGTAAAATFSEAGAGLGLSDSNNIAVAAKDAKATIDGVAITRSKNVIDDAVTGLTFTLVAPHDTPTASAQVGVTLDTDGLKSKLQSVVQAYNAVNSALHVQLDYSGTQKGTNTLFGDSTLRQLQGALGGVMSNAYGPGVATKNISDTTTLGAIGLVRAKDGSLSLDDTKLSAALAANPDAVGNLFVGGGFATAMTGLTDSYTRAGDGLLASKTRSLSDRFNALQTQVDRINSHADALKTQLEKQFTALETAMSKLKSQSSYLSSIFG